MVNLSFLLCFSEGGNRYKINKESAEPEVQESYLPSDKSDSSSNASTVGVRKAPSLVCAPWSMSYFYYIATHTHLFGGCAREIYNLLAYIIQVEKVLFAYRSRMSLMHRH